METNSNLILVFVILILATIGFYGAGLFTLFRTLSFLRRARKVSGVVVNLSTGKNSDNGITYIPIVSFQAADNREYHISGRTGANPPAYRIGQSVTVCYLPERPQDAKLRAFFDLYFFPLFYLLFGAVFSFAATVFYFDSIH